MIKATDFSSPTGHTYLKCTQCKQQFYIINSSFYIKTVNYCPYCGTDAREKHTDPLEFEDYYNETLNG